jgi:hypothetical protein
MTRKLSYRQKNLLAELYVHQVLKKGTDGTFRDRFMEGCQRGYWNIYETERLSELGLVRISQDLMLAGIVCVGITNSGRKYQEKP